MLLFRHSALAGSSESVVQILDNTLRESMQVPGVVFDAADRRVIADALVAGGVDMLDVGLPGSVPEWKELAEFNRSLRGRVATGVTVRALAQDLALASDHGFSSVFMMAPVSEIHLEHKFHMPRRDLWRLVDRLTGEALGRGLKPMWVAEDASRASKALLTEFVARASGAGAEAIYLCDTVGVLVPQGVDAWIATAREGMLQGRNVALGVHCHNDFGMATANTITAAGLGVQWLSTTLSGLGERAGNASTLAVAAASIRLLGISRDWDLAALATAEREIEQRTGLPLPVLAPLVGWNAFRHESGIHVDGVLKLPRIYEPLDPQDVGADRTLTLGATSGRAHVRFLLAQLNIQVTEGQLERIFEKLRLNAMRKPPERTGFLASYYAYLGNLGVSESAFADLVRQVVGEPPCSP